jgi:hypothetical protein
MLGLLTAANLKFVIMLADLKLFVKHDYHSTAELDCSKNV